MVFLRSGAVALLLLMTACSGVSRTTRSLSDVSDVLPKNVVSYVDVSMLEGRLDNALHVATAVVLGIRRVDEPCGTYLEAKG